MKMLAGAETNIEATGGEGDVLVSSWTKADLVEAEILLPRANRGNGDNCFCLDQEKLVQARGRTTFIVDTNLDKLTLHYSFKVAHKVSTLQLPLSG